MNPLAAVSRLKPGLGARIALGAVAVAALAGCNGAQLVDVWQDPAWSGAPMRSVLVVSQRGDPTARRLWEDAVSAQMSRRGVNAVASWQRYPDAPPSREEMDGALSGGDFDGALVLKPLRATTQTSWVPGWTSVEPRGYYDPWGRGNVIVYRERYHRGYAVSERIAREQVTLWSGKDGGRMVWAGTVEAPGDGSADDLRGDIASGVVPEMRKAGLI